MRDCRVTVAFPLLIPIHVHSSGFISRSEVRLRHAVTPMFCCSTVELLALDQKKWGMDLVSQLSLILFPT